MTGRENEESERESQESSSAIAGSPPTPQHTRPTILQLVDDLYRRRVQPGCVEESVSLLTNSREANNDYEGQWRMARALFFLGQCLEVSDQKRQLHSTAVQAGRRASSSNSGGVEGHFWLGVNLALFAEASGGFRAARALLRARRELKRAAAISESYHGAGPLRVLGRLEHRAPFFLGGSRRRSLAYFDRALAISANSVTMIYTAELLLSIGDLARAFDLLQQAAALPVDPEWEFENLRDRKRAQSMLTEAASGM